MAQLLKCLLQSHENLSLTSTTHIRTNKKAQMLWYMLKILVLRKISGAQGLARLSQTC